MTPLICKYYRDTGFRDGQSWEDGTLLQFVALSHGGVVGVVFCHRGGGLLYLKLDDIRLERADQAGRLVASPLSNISDVRQSEDS